MKIIERKTITQTIEKELPFDINIFKEDIDDCDWFDPNDPNEWEWFVNDWVNDWCSNEYSKEEIEEHKDEIIKLMQDKRKKGIQSEMDYHLDYPLSNVRGCEYKITEEEIHNYITNWFKEN